MSHISCAFLCVFVVVEEFSIDADNSWFAVETCCFDEENKC